MSLGTERDSTSSRSARWAVAPALPNKLACCSRLVLEIIRPVFPLRVTIQSQRPAMARTSSSRSSARSTSIAFGPRATPAPISRNSGAAS